MSMRAGALSLANGAASYGDGGVDNPPDWCFEPNDAGDLPSCTYVNGQWHRSFEGNPMMNDGGGVPAFFGVAFVAALILAIGAAFWRVSTARRIARDAGMNESDATAMSLISDHGLESTYLAANLRQAQAQAAGSGESGAAAAEPRAAADRLRDLQGLLDQGLVTQDEYDSRRRAILDEL